MSPDQAENAIVQAFKTWWEARHSASPIPVSYPDVPFDVTTQAPPWARLSITWSGAGYAGAGKREERHTGFVFAELYWPDGEGYADASSEAEAVRIFFRDLALDGGRLQCKGIVDGARPYVTKPPKEPGFTRRTVNVPVRLMTAS